jgi:hypothetical protein
MFAPVDINLQQVVDFLNFYAYIKMSLIIQKNNQKSTGSRGGTVIRLILS